MKEVQRKRQGMHDAGEVHAHDHRSERCDHPDNVGEEQEDWHGDEWRSDSTEGHHQMDLQTASGRTLDTDVLFPRPG